MSAALHAISPLDGRYRSRLESTASHFSEYSYIKHRVEVEIEYFISLLKMSPPLPQLSSMSPPSPELTLKLQSVCAFLLSMQYRLPQAELTMRFAADLQGLHRGGRSMGKAD